MASLSTTHRWCIAPNNPELEERLASALGVAPLVARIMVALGSGGVEAGEPSLDITVDNGIAAREEVVARAGRGIDIVVTDHHEPTDLVPVGIPLTDP